MAHYRPRCQVKLIVPNVGDPQTRTQQEDLDDVTELHVRCYKLRLASNSHNEADEAEVWLSYDDAGIDPRFLRSCEIYIYLGDANEDGSFTASPDTLRFVGIACEVERTFRPDGEKAIRIRAQDYTTLFIAAKNYPASKIPEFSMSLEDAWSYICDNTGYFDLATNSIVSTVARLRDRIDIVGNVPSVTLGSAVSPRIAKLGKVQVKHGSDAWAVWQTCVGSLGLVSFMRNDRCIVTTATDYYTADDPPKLAYGKNILEIVETRDVNGLSSKNVGILSFNPLTGKTLEAFWPPLSYVQTGRGKKKKLGASALGSGAAVKASDYEMFYVPVPTTDPKVLEQVAKRVWEERSRQEMRGRLKTAEMFVDTLSGQSFDLLSLQAGDRIRVDIDRSALTDIQRLGSLIQRIEALRFRGYSSDMASYIATNLDAITKLPAEYQVHSVALNVDWGESDGGEYDMEINYLNRIDVSGSSQPGEGTSDIAPVTGEKVDAAAAAAQRRRDDSNPARGTT